MDCSPHPPGSSAHGIFQARILEWGASSFSRRSSRPRDRTRVSFASCMGRRVLCHWHHLGSPINVLGGPSFPQASRGSSAGKESTRNAGDPSSISCIRKIPWRREWLPTPLFWGFLGGLAGEESPCKVGDLGLIPGLGGFPGKGLGYPLQYSWASLVAQLVKNLPAMQETWVGKIPWRRAWQPTPVFLPGESPWTGAWWVTVHGVAKSQTRLSD